MDRDSKLLSELFVQQRDLNAEQIRISQELVEVNQKIQYLLVLHANRALEVRSAVPVTESVSSARMSNGLRKNGIRHSWFDRGEATKLIRRVARRSMRPAQIVHAIMDVKGYTNSLASDDKRRAEAALHQAVISAVKAGALARDRDGAVQTTA